MNATNIMVDNHVIIKNGYIQLMKPFAVTEEWLNSESVIDGFETNRDCILEPLRNNKIVEADLEVFMERTVYAVPDESLYGTYLEMLRQDTIVSQNLSSEELVQDFLEKSDNLVEGLCSLYNTVTDLLIQRMWSYILLRRNQTQSRYLGVYETLYAVSAMQALLIISVNTPKFCLDQCFQKVEDTKHE